jgi:hypothetical protein
MRADSSKRLTVFSEAEKRALYGLPDFDDFQRAEFFAMTETERALVDRRSGLTERLHCLLQIGYFKAKQAFFNVSEQDVPAEDITFLLKRYFPDRPDGTEALRPLRRNEQYAQRDEIAELFGYRLWTETDRPVFVQMAASLARRDVTPTFVLIEVLAALNAKKIVRPGYRHCRPSSAMRSRPSANAWSNSSKPAWTPPHTLRCGTCSRTRTRCPNWPPSSRMPDISVTR